MPKTLKQTVRFRATPHEIYEMLMDSKKHAAFTGATAKISPKVGGKISAWDGYIEGKNLKLVEGKKIIQAWRATDWPEKHFSTATFELKKDGTGTKITLTQTNVPDGYHKDISQGWKDFYWKPLTAALLSRK